MRKEYLPYARQNIDEKDTEAVVKVLKSDWITTGPNVDAFESALKEYVGVKHAVAVSSGTSGLDIAVQSLELDGGEIITTPFTFAATTNCILFNGLKQVYSDIKEDTYNIDPMDIKRKITEKTRAIIYVDYAGQPCDIKEIKEIADEYDLYLIEDAAHALGAKYNGKKVGGFADITIFSFHPVKHITTGEGGMCTTNDVELADKMKTMRNHGIDKDAKIRHGSNAGWVYDIKYLARNYRLTDLQCVLGISQIKKIEESIKKRNEIAITYNKLFEEVSKIITPYKKPQVRHAYHLYPILVNNIERDKFFKDMRNRNIGVNVHYIPTYRFSYHKKNINVNPKDYPITEKIFNKEISLPMFPQMTDEDIKYVVNSSVRAIE